MCPPSKDLVPSVRPQSHCSCLVFPSDPHKSGPRSLFGINLHDLVDINMLLSLLLRSYRLSRSPEETFFPVYGDQYCSTQQKYYAIMAGIMENVCQPGIDCPASCFRDSAAVACVHLHTAQGHLCQISAARHDASLHVIAASRRGEQHIPVILSRENSNLFLQRGICPSTSN